MKRINNYVLNGAIALLSTAGLVACSSSDDVTDAPVNPTYDGKSVKTQFAINVADNTPKNSTRMSGENTQQTGYLSMANIYLLPIKTTASQSINENTEVLSLIPLNDPSSVTTSRSSHIYSDVNVPVGANNFLFYSTRNNLGTDMNDKFITGSIKGKLIGATTVPAVDNTGDITFALEEILDATNNSSLTEVEGYFEEYLNSIKGVAEWSTQTGNDLATLYNQFTNFGTEKIRAGSAFAVLKLVSELYDKVKPISENGTDPQKTIAQNIVNAITATTGNVTVEVNSDITAENPYSLKYSTSDTNITKFPAAQGLPEGAAQLTITSGDFKYTNQPSIGGGTMTDPTFNIYNLTYPAPITYFDNTPLKATEKEIQDSEWQKTASAWDSWNDWANWGDVILSTSRSVALKNNINYGVACLETTFKCSTAGTLEDNKAEIITGEKNQTITVPTAGFPVTGILIGGQPKKVNWQYISTSSQPADYDYVAYDRDLTDIYAVKTGNPVSNYTLVLDNFTDAQTGQPKVNVAVELVNTAEDFYGKDGLIAKGQKFYLIATLDPSQGTEVKWPSYDGTTPSFDLKDSYKGRYPVQNRKNRVFVQDFTTKADFTINTLKNAYVTLPDLRASLLQLGLSVDLKWQSGMTFDVPLGGTTN